MEFLGVLQVSSHHHHHHHRRHQLLQVGGSRSSMAELEDDTQGDLTGTLEESDDVRRIKEEWTRLQMEADGRREQMLEDASTRRSEIQEETNRRKAEFGARKTASVDGHDGKKLPPSRLPSLDSMVDRIPSIPSMEITTGLGKK